MEYGWTEKKRLTNIAKHQVDFLIAYGFEWDAALVRMSASANEPRLVAIGPIDLRLYVLVYSIERRALQIISLRKANSREFKLYEAHI